MRRKIKRLVVLTVVLSYLFSGTVLARDIAKYNEAKNTYVDSGLLPKTEQEGKGVIKIWAETNMYKPVDWACLTVYLEQWDEEERSWEIVGEYEREFLPEDEEDGELTSAVLDLAFTGQPMGYYYRARVMHELEFDGDWYEIRVTKTEGILMEYVP